MYAVGSVSKSLTGTALYALVAAGVIDTGQPVSRYLKSMKLQTYAGEPTVAQLISMRAGVPHGWEYVEAPNLPKDEWKRHAIVAFAPGTSFVYSNIAYGIVGVVVSDTTGKSLDEAAMFAPLGMTHTALYPSKVQGTVPCHWLFSTRPSPSLSHCAGRGRGL
jgi:CubicO group peptidase (beta-lactamase class C family)